MVLCILDVLDYFNLVKKKGGYSNEKHKKIDYRKCVEHDGC
ncbi:hypothetical protein SEEM5278_08129 [Salmonella enterica subsp. enterica serovar Montevideo str. CT_02035278]|nr:hypothetical protein SEEM315_18140 [Salmonella enterica subsp. enterica serovar Montevideo str. 315996572]EFY16971.1 hypothetical protein SEEM971_15851 [Salmonella enterica subsp. enterica serovar Montevideo str. 495297-1]EFY20233.1 hypothetical protein SEEM973_06261 [Salmonella enterica subsp. enterica serovar Montevideo str. 495297-3]EFY26087.1 hypothetical protein SEEM974_10173 [Salmonella enterica subsp. enterica serovar Montevideo str. 495297-4]EFY28782.1 hypothetical protein SEEM201_09